MDRRRLALIARGFLSLPVALLVGYLLIHEPTVPVEIVNRTGAPATEVVATFSRRGDFDWGDPPPPWMPPVVINRPAGRREIGRLGPGESRWLRIPRVASALVVVEYRDRSGRRRGATAGYVPPEGQVLADLRVNLMETGNESGFSTRLPFFESVYWRLRNKIGL